MPINIIPLSDLCKGSLFFWLAQCSDIPGNLLLFIWTCIKAVHPRLSSTHNIPSMSLLSYSCHSLASTSALSLKPESIYDHLPLASASVPRPPLIFYDEPQPAEKPDMPLESYETPLFPLCSRYIWFNIDAKMTLAGLQDPEVDAVTEVMKGKTYVGCTVKVRPSKITLSKLIIV